MARADATAKGKAAYQDFLTLWEDADPDIPIFIAAKVEIREAALVPEGEFARLEVDG